jgi:8-oxo-dGTP pyrophosphatase MutT (NUDIX family)
MGKMQIGALPVRQTPQGAWLVLLVTARNKSRWIIPKGHRSRSRSDRKSAAREAREEGGVKGRAGAIIGSYLHPRRGRRTAVTVYLFHVEGDAKIWAERSVRRRQWVDPGRAIAMVDPDGLRTILAKLPAGLNAG